MEGKRSQGLVCSPIKVLHELGSNRPEAKKLAFEPFEPGGSKTSNIMAALDSNI